MSSRKSRTPFPNRAPVRKRVVAVAYRPGWGITFTTAKNGKPGKPAGVTL